jgi:hypothetical protein
MKKFESVGDHDAYLDWVSKHNNGYVLNRTLKDFATLHRATCGTIRGNPANGKLYVGQSKKYCSKQIQVLENFGVVEWGFVPARHGCLLSPPK